MFRALTLAILLAGLPGPAPGQEPGALLHVRITLTNAAGASIPVRGHALLISDNPSSALPRRTITAADGTATVRLRPGNYTVESDEPLVFQGASYQWTQIIDIAPGRDVTLELTAANAEVGAASAASSPAALEANAPSILLEWQDSIVAVWTPRARASGFVADAAGLVVTNQHTVGAATSVEVQLSPSVKVAGRVLVSDRLRDVAVLWIDPSVVASVRPVPLNCADAAKPAVADGQRLVAVGAPLRGDKEAAAGDVFRADSKAIVADFRLRPGGIGGPVFGDEGRVVGVTSFADGEDGRSRRDARVVPLADVCAAIQSAEKARAAETRPSAAHLPIEPERPFPADVLETAAKTRAGSLNAYQTSSSDFDLTFLTPVTIHAAPRRTPQTDFGEWSEYFADTPPVLAVRATPKMAENFWTTIARGAAYTQGIAVPAVKHFKPGFSRLRAWCGDVEVMPIHPFVLEQRVSETDAIHEGLYIFEPRAFGPQCSSVRFVLYSEKAPDKADTRTIEPRVIKTIADDFASYK